jgi:hypothetical protein
MTGPMIDTPSPRPTAALTRRLPSTALLIAALTVVGTSVGCDLGGTRGDGAVKSETRQVAAFSRVETSAGIGISVQIGPAGTLDVRAQENLLPIILTDVENGTLRLRSASNYTTTEKVEVIVTTPSLTGIVLSGGSQGRVEGLEEPRFDIDLSGGSRLTATGEATDLALGASGGSSANLEGLSAQTIKVGASGGSTARVRASQRVHGSASGGTTITVLGDAALGVETTGASHVDRG